MARRKRKSKKISIQFHLSLSGLFGLGIVCFCIFLWMFLLGIWAGQTILLPSAGSGKPLSINRFAGLLSAQDKQSADVIREDNLEPPAAADTASGLDISEPSFFSLQVGAFRDSERAQKARQNWKGQGYDAFVQAPDDADDLFWRVFVGKFKNLAEANNLAARLEKKENTKAYIALLPASKILIP